MTLSQYEVLEQARNLIADPSRWIQEDYYVFREDGVKCFCAVGAIAEVLGTPPHDEIYCVDLVAEAAGLEYAYDVPSFNDSHTHAEVIAAFDRAIEKARASA